MATEITEEIYPGTIVMRGVTVLEKEIIEILDEIPEVIVLDIGILDIIQMFEILEAGTDTEILEAIAEVLKTDTLEKNMLIEDMTEIGVLLDPFHLTILEHREIIET